MLRTFTLFASLVGLHIRNHQLYEERERFFAVVAHDLRTPLGVAAMVSSILTTHSDPGVVKLARRLERSVSHMSAIVSDATDVARGRIGERIPLETVRMDASAFVRDLLEDLFDGKDHPLEAELDDDIQVTWDPTRIGQLLTNLLANAQRYCAHGTPICVRLAGTEHHVTIEVSNQGEPIDPDLLPNLFQPFRRGARSPGSGLGLGLYIVRQIAIAHGGDVEVESDVKRTVFTARLSRHVDA